MKTKISSFSLALCLMLLSLTSHAQQTMRVFMIGNSVTDGVNYYGLNSLAEDPSGPGNNHIWARLMIPGAPLFMLWDASQARADYAFTETPFGYPIDAFVNYEWDAITLQPFDRQLVDTDPVNGQGDVLQSVRFANLAKTKSPNVQFYILGRYPRADNDNNDPANDAAHTADSWNTTYTTPYSEYYNNSECREYPVQLAAAATAAAPSLSKPFLVIPLGEIMYSLNNKMKAGQVPGYTKIWQLYADGIHLTTTGSYVNACAFYATIYKESPVGRIVPSEYGAIPPAVALIIQQTAWEVVSTYPLAGIFGTVVTPVSSVSVTPSTLSIAIDQTYQLVPAVAPSNASNQNLTWSTSSAAVATVSATGVVTGKSVGSATITLTSQADASKKSTCTVTVVSDPIAVTGLTLSPTTLSIKRGNSSPLTVTVAPSNATNTAMNWSSSDPTKATVDANGVVSALAVGTTTITATSVSNPTKLATTAVTVLANAAPVAVITASTVSGTAPLVVNFSSASSTDADAGDYVLGFEWDFDDSTPLDKSGAPTHTFAAEGTYIVKLRVMDNNNLYGDMVTTTITVAPGVNSTGIATWDSYQLHGVWGGNPEVYTPITPVATSAPGVASAGVTVSPLTISSTMLTRSENASDADLLGINGLNSSCFSFATAKTEGNYLECTITPVSGKSVTITSIDIAAVSGGAAGVCSLTSSVDNYSAALSTITLGLTNEINIHPLQTFTVTGHTALTAPVTFRFYFHAAAQWGLEYSKVGIGNRHPSESTTSLQVNGLVADVTTGLTTQHATGYTIYPNPATDKLSLNFGTAYKTATISILDLQGRSLLSQTAANTQVESLDISSLNNGIYFVRVIADGKVMNSKFVKK